MIFILFFNLSCSVLHQRLHYLETANGNNLVLVINKFVDIDILVELCDYKINTFTPIGSFREVGLNLFSEDIQNKIKRDFKEKKLALFIVQNCTLSLQNRYAIRYFKKEREYLYYQLLPDSFELNLSITLSHYIYDLLILSKIFYDAYELINIQKSVYEILQKKQRNPQSDKILNKLTRDIPKSEGILKFLERLNVTYKNIEHKYELLKKRNEIQANLRKKYDIELFLENHQDRIFKVLETYECMLRNNKVYRKKYEDFFWLIKKNNN